MTKDPLFVKHFGLLAYGEQYEQLLPLAQSYAKEISIGFMKWYGVKIMGFIIYLKEVKPNVTSNEIEEKMKEFEGKTYEELFNIYLKEKEQ